MKSFEKIFIFDQKMSQQLELLTENPSQWTPVMYVTPEIQKKEIKPFVALAIKELEGNPDSRLRSLMNVDKYAAVRAVVRHVARLRSGTRECWNEHDVRMFVEGLRFSPESTSELTALLCTEQIYSNMPTHLRVKPGLASLSWRIDLSLGQSQMKSENLTPDRKKQILHTHTYILLSLTLTDGQTYRYRLTVNKFHELRFVVANALKNMIVLEKRKCMRKD